MNNRTHTPLFHVAKRGALPWYKVWAIRGAGLLLALLVCSLITTLVTKQNPLEVYGAIVNGSFGSPRKIWILLQNIAMLLCVSLAVTPAFRMRCWNLGGEGQALIGGLAAAACMILQAKVGYVGAFPYAEVVSGFTSFFLGVRNVCPEATMEVTFTNSWYG